MVEVAENLWNKTISALTKGLIFRNQIPTTARPCSTLIHIVVLKKFSFITGVLFFVNSAVLFAIVGAGNPRVRRHTGNQIAKLHFSKQKIELKTVP